MIRINDDYYIESDGRQYILCKDNHQMARKARGDGTFWEYPDYDALGYFQTLGSAVKALANRMMLDGVKDKDINLTEAVAEYQRITKILTDTIDKAELTALIDSLEDDLE